ncbi:MAG: hypothetical protein ACRCX2_23500 [Paraclostridium sp.]
MALYKYVVLYRKKRYLFLVVLLSLVVSSVSTFFLWYNSELTSFMGSFLGSILSVLGAYWIFSIDTKYPNDDDLECLLALLKFTVLKVDRVLASSCNIKSNKSTNIVQFSYNLIYDKEWRRYLRRIERYEDKEAIIKFLDYIQRDKNIMLGDLISYRQDIVDILNTYGKYDDSIDKIDFYSDLQEKYDRAVATK